jgi:hypothetical protein
VANFLFILFWLKIANRSLKRLNLKITKLSEAHSLLENPREPPELVRLVVNLRFFGDAAANFLAWLPLFFGVATELFLAMLSNFFGLAAAIFFLAMLP